MPHFWLVNVINYFLTLSRSLSNNLYVKCSANRTFRRYISLVVEHMQEFVDSKWKSESVTDCIFNSHCCCCCFLSFHFIPFDVVFPRGCVYTTKIIVYGNIRWNTHMILLIVSYCCYRMRVRYQVNVNVQCYRFNVCDNLQQPVEMCVLITNLCVWVFVFRVQSK